MTFIISIFWLVVFTRKLFFWIYLWQLKEYHIGRFLDHFRTYKGKRLILNYLLLAKIIIFLIIIFYPYPSLFYLVLAVFSFEFLLVAKHSFQKTLKIPVLTKKTNLILTAGISLELLVLSLLFSFKVSTGGFIKYLLGLDILTPLVFSILVLLFQPLAVAWREQTIKRAEKKREKFEELLAIGITGSYGKTSVKEFLATILAEKYKVLKTKEHQNSEVGISGCILNDLGEEHEIFVVEMGAYKRGGIKLLSEIVKPKIGILTGINEQHMATFGSQENIIKTKFELIDSLPEDGLAILNYSDPKIKGERIQDHNPKLKNVISYSLEKGTDFWAEDIKIKKETISFKVVSKEGERANFSLNLLGMQNIHNILAVVCCAKYLGMSFEEISKACAKIELWQSGMQLKKGILGFNVIDATYSANPSGVISHLDYLKVWPGKKILVMPCLIELGKASKEVHKKIGEKIAEVVDLAIITTRDRFEEIKEGVEKLPQTQPREKQVDVLFLEKPDEITDKVKSFAKPDDVVLLESRIPGKVIDSLAR